MLIETKFEAGSSMQAACGLSDSLAIERLTQTTVLVKPTQPVIPSQPPTNVPTIALPVLTEALTPLLTTIQFAENRQTAWNASGFKLTSAEDLVLSTGTPAKAFIITTAESSEGCYLFTILGGNYLIVGSRGDLALFDLVAHSIR
jgi:hypothetical protein